MWFRLALALGSTVADLRRRMTGREFVEWCAYYECEPWGDERADLRAGIVAATVANVHRSKGPSFKPGDFMPKFQQRHTIGRQQTAQEMHAQAMRACGIS